MKTEWAKIILAILVLVVIVILGEPYMLELPIRIFGGWVFFVRDVIPRINLNYSAIAMFILIVPAVTMMSHNFSVWLWKSQSHVKRWRLRWTTAGVGAVMLLFVAGTAATGIVHQMGWLITSPKPLVSSTSQYQRAYHIKCASNLRQIFLSLREYKDNYPGFTPTCMVDVIDAIAASDVDPRVFFCPAHSDDPPGDLTWAKIRDALLQNDTQFTHYLLAPPGTIAPDGKSIVLMYEKQIDNHSLDGIHLLYTDGRVEWIDTPEALKWLNELPHLPLHHTPATVPSTQTSQR